MKTCSKCKKDKELVEFDKTGMRGYRANCKACRREQRKGCPTQRNGWYKRKYGITLEDYNKIFTEQKGCCKICNTHQVELKIRLAVDHCHTTGKVRGLLCDTCNRGLGYLKDSPELLNNAINYLKETK